MDGDGNTILEARNLYHVYESKAEDGNVVVTTGHPDVGGSRASIANITAELLGIDQRARARRAPGQIPSPRPCCDPALGCARFASPFHTPSGHAAVTVRVPVLRGLLRAPGRSAACWWSGACPPRPPTRCSAAAGGPGSPCPPTPSPQGLRVLTRARVWAPAPPCLRWPERSCNSCALGPPAAAALIRGGKCPPFRQHLARRRADQGAS